MSHPHSTIIVMLPPPQHTPQRLRPLIYHRLDVHQLAHGTHQRRHHSQRHPHAIHHCRRLSVPPFRDTTSPSFSPASPRLSPH
jgi:hypothetical protein